MADSALACAMLAVLVAGLAAAGAARLARYCAALTDLREPEAELWQLLPALRTGDLVLFVGAAGPSVAALAAGTFFSHAGVVVRPGGAGRAWISETTPAAPLMHAGRHRLRHGADLAPLLVRLSNYLGRSYVARLRPPLGRAQAARLEAEARRLCGEPYPSLARLAGALCGWPAPRHCFQHVHHLLRTAGLPVGAEPGPVAACRAVCALPGRRLGGRAFGPPRRLAWGPAGAEKAAGPPSPR
jgi:hypothetical protein